MKLQFILRIYVNSSSFRLLCTVFIISKLWLQISLSNFWRVVTVNRFSSFLWIKSWWQMEGRRQVLPESWQSVCSNETTKKKKNCETFETILGKKKIFCLSDCERHREEHLQHHVWFVSRMFFTVQIFQLVEWNGSLGAKIMMENKRLILLSIN